MIPCGEQFRRRHLINDLRANMKDPTEMSILALGCDERYDHFLNRAGEEREIWILVNQEQCFLKIQDEDEGFEYLPVWPDRELAQHFAKGAKGLTPKSIPVATFLRKWIPGLERDKLQVGVLPGLDNSIWLIDPSELERDLRDELEAG